MAVTTEKTAEQYLNVVANTPIDVDIPLFAEAEMFLLYGNSGVADAVLDTDFTVTLAVDFASFVLTPLPALLTKINALIVQDPTEINRIVVRRSLDYTTVSTPGAVTGARFASQEFDRTAMKFMQLHEQMDRAVILGDQYVDVDPPTLTLGTEGQSLVFGANNTIVPGPDASDIAAAQGNAAQVAADAVQVAADRVAVHADKLAADVDAASAANSATVALATKGSPRGPWVTATAYADYDVARQGTAQYMVPAGKAHTSGVFATDLAAGKWTVWLQDGPAGAGSGDMAKATYDPNNKNGDAFDMSLMVENLGGAGSLKMTSAERTKLGGIATGAQVTNAANIYAAENGVSSATIVSSDKLSFLDVSAVGLAWTLVSDFVTFLSTALAGVFAPLVHTHSFASLTSKPTTLAGYGLSSSDLLVSAGAIASYALAFRTNGGGFSFGDTFAGSGLRATTVEGNSFSGPTLSGTWRAMGASDGGGSEQSCSVFNRIS